MSEPTLVLADTDEARRGARIALLARHGYRAISAATAAETLDLAARQRPALVLLAGALADLETAELARRLRALPAAPLIACVATDELPHWEGADIYLREPITPEEFLANLGTLVRLHRRPSEHHDAGRLAEIEAIYDSAPVGLCVLDPECRYLRVNRRLAEFTGLPPAELVGKPIRAILPHLAESVAVWEANVRQVIATGEPILGYEVSADAPHERGLPRHFLSDWCPLKRNGVTYAVTVVAIDITAWKSAEKALRESEDRIRFILDCSKVGAWELDLDIGTYIFSDESYPLLGFDGSRPNNAEAEWMALIHPEDRERVEASWQWEVAETSGSCSAEYRILHPEKGVRWILGWAGLERDASGRLVRVGGISFDITEWKQMEEELRALNDSLAEADRRKDEFLAILGHELRNPLTTLINSVDILRGMPVAEADAQTAAEVRGMVDRQLVHLTRLVDDLLDVSRLTHGRIELRKEHIDLAEVVEGALEVVRPLLKKHGHELCVGLPAASLRLFADPTRLTQVLENLLTNAAKYTPPGSCIHLEAERTGENLAIRVRDNGRGISADVMPRLFDPFTQDRRSLDRSEGGLGIGLAIVKRLVELHGGSVTVASSGNGSEFTVTLPAGEASPEPSPRPVAVDRPDEAAESRRVLVVDDSEDARDSLALLLQLIGHEVRKAADGRVALALAPEFRPDVVLLDIDLPDMDGYEVARLLRQQAQSSGVVLVAVTGFGQRENHRCWRAAGFDHCLVKPFDIAALGRVMGPRSA